MDEPGLTTLTSRAPAVPFWWQTRSWALLLVCLSAGGLIGALMLWQKLNSIQEELARRSLDTATQAVEARTLARQANDGMNEILARLAILETRLSEVSLQRTQLEELMQSLSRSRDENLVVDIDSALRLAQQQAQLTGSSEPLLAALKTAEQRLTRAAQPRLNPLQRAIARDSDRIRSAVLTDVPSLMLKIDELARAVDELPVANAAPAVNPQRAPLTIQARPAVAAAQPGASAPSGSTAVAGAVAFNLRALRDWSERAWQSIQAEARSLLRVSRIDQPEAALLAPEQSFFLRENVKLKLLNARLALLSRQSETARSDLAAVQELMSRYFDGGSRKTQSALALLTQIRSQLKSTELPRLDETFSALGTAAAGR